MAGSEFSFIEEFLRLFPVDPAPMGPGDDCAVLPATKGALCVTVDSVVEGVHFQRPAFSWEDIGHKALAVNLSDLAAMGASPSWFLCAISAPRSLKLDAVRGLARGMARLAAAHHISLVGGNFTAARELSLTVTAAGNVLKGSALLRSGARPGDLLYVSGTVGDARLGLALSTREIPPKLRRSLGAAAVRTLLTRQTRPQPRVALGRISRRYASAAIDVSDGLAQDAGHLAKGSGVRVVLDARRLPLSASMRHAQGVFPPCTAWPLAGGEDYELLLTVPARRSVEFERACRQGRQKITRIGEIQRGAGVRLRDSSSALPEGFDHFR